MKQFRFSCIRPCELLPAVDSRIENFFQIWVSDNTLEQMPVSILSGFASYPCKNPNFSLCIADVVPPYAPATRHRRLCRPHHGVPLRRQRHVRIATPPGLREERWQADAPGGRPDRQPPRPQDIQEGRFHVRASVAVREAFPGARENAAGSEIAEVPGDRAAPCANSRHEAGDFQADGRSALLASVDHPRGYGAAEGYTDVPGVTAEFDDHYARTHAELGFRGRLCQYCLDYLSVAQAVQTQVICESDDSDYLL